MSFSILNTIVIKEIAHNSDLYKEEVNLRFKILREPLSLLYTQEQLDDEKDQFHLCAFENEKLIGCLLLKPINQNIIQMRQVAVSRDYQGKGIGKHLVIQSEEYALNKGFNKMILHARETAIPFYQKLNYQLEGEKFIEVTIPHMKMWKNL
ncbi:MAG: GNAT family N-acetyltransferase [Ignavibacteria bacterium]|nr:GNAT family N-acetyltransferase [Ignavibacteria bacterium]